MHRPKSKRFVRGNLCFAVVASNFLIGGAIRLVPVLFFMAKSEAAFVFEATLFYFCGKIVWLGARDAAARLLVKERLRHVLAWPRQMDNINQKKKIMEENKSIWNGCAISGDIAELDKIAESSGIINLDKQDIVDTLDKAGISYVASAVAASFGQALKMAADALPAPIGESKNLLIQFYFGTRQPMMSELGEVTAMLDSVNGASSVVWGMASDPSLGENCKVVIVASSPTQLSSLGNA